MSDWRRKQQNWHLSGLSATTLLRMWYQVHFPRYPWTAKCKPPEYDTVAEQFGWRSVWVFNSQLVFTSAFCNQQRRGKKNSWWFWNKLNNVLLYLFFCRMMKSSSRAQPQFTRSNRNSAWLLKALETDSAFLSPSPIPRYWFKVHVLVFSYFSVVIHLKPKNW